VRSCVRTPPKQQDLRVWTLKRNGALPPPLFETVVAVLNLLDSVTAHNGPKNPGGHTGSVVVGLLLIGLCALLMTWSRFHYVGVMASLVVLIATNFVNTYTLSEVNVVVPLVLLVIPFRLLAVGWRRYRETAPPVNFSTPPHVGDH
jgi:hypothetical protein